MSTEVTKILTADESSIIELLQYVHADAEDFDDPENGDYLERMEALFSGASELDATVVKIAVDRTHFFMGEWTESGFSIESYYVVPETSPATDRLNEALASTIVVESEGIKGEILEIVDRLQVDYFWRNSDYPDADILRDLLSLISEHRIQDFTLSEFVSDNILFPWNEFLEILGHPIPADSEHFEWHEQCMVLNKTRW